MLLTVNFSEEANATFESIGEQLRARWGDKEVNEFRKRTYKVIDLIAKFPLIFQGVNKEESIRKAFVHKTVLCFMKLRTTR